MKKFNLYYINIDYIKYLYQYETKVQYNPRTNDEYTKRRPYLGIVLEINKLNYFVPLEHPRKEHRQIKNNIYIYKIHKGNYGILGFNNMIPVPDKALTQININQQRAAYRQILISQYRFCNKHSDIILRKALNTYIQYENGNNKFLQSVCCNFKKLEEKLQEYGGV